ncbi:ankyrin repeat-containing domain protein [Cladorrhinum samala]|uniref:Ankyrin repeat-containing domain protein n=1 Tax=Cladorrhinum samala TaxID=585594 RepID=A0AAV9HWF5_9PEZI|nr:ankyrin repeat-containing domain protein [Cladorrhinum samala]
MTYTSASRFRWAECQLITLRECSSRASIERALAELPEDLESTYQRVLERIPKEKTKTVIEIVEWLLFPGRTLTVQEVAESIAIDVDNEMVNPTERYLRQSEVLKLCPGLTDTIVTTEKNIDNFGKVTEIEVIRLAHYSVKEYLMFGRGLQRFYIEERVAGTYLARAYLTYLKYHEGESVKNPTKIPHPLAVDAARYWPQHARAGENGDERGPLMAKRPLTRQSDELLTSPSALASWTRLFDPDHGKARPEAPIYNDFPTPLYYVSLCGLPQYVRYLIDDRGAEEDVVKDRGQFGTALRPACQHGFALVVSTLLEAAGADINARSGRFTDDITMKLVAANGHTEVVRVLAKKQLETSGAETYLDEMDAPAFHGYTDIIKLLLESSDTNINSEVGPDGRLLQRAPSTGRAETVSVLPLYGADKNIESGWYGTALRAAALKGYDAVVRILLDARADLYLHGNSPGTPLNIAISFSRKTIIYMIIDHGHDVNYNEGHHGTVFQVAAHKGDLEVVNLLLGTGANVNAEGDMFHTALQAAAFTWHQDIVESLLHHGALLDTPQGGPADVIRLLPLMRKHRGIVETLIKAGADIGNQRGVSPFGSLQIAQAGECREVEKLLRDAGAVESRLKHSWISLWVLCSLPWIDVG